MLTIVSNGGFTVIMINPLGTASFINSTASAQKAVAQSTAPGIDSHPSLPSESFSKNVKIGEGSALLPKGLQETKTPAAAEEDGRVISADVNEIFKIDAPQEQPEPSAEKAWGLSDSYAHSQGPVLALIDTGVQVDHPDLQNSLWRNPGEIAGNGLDDDNNGVIDDIHGFNAIDNSGDVTDHDGSGTHAAGIIAGVGVSETKVSTGGARLFPIKIFNEDGSTDSASIIRAINHATDA